MQAPAAVIHLGLYPIGADNRPSKLERALAQRAMDVYADKRKPEGDNPIAATVTAILDVSAAKWLAS